MDSVDEHEYQGALSAVQKALGVEGFSAAWSEGEHMPLDAVLEFALQEPEPAAADSATNEKEKFGGLTRREREWRHGSLRGKSNREIADAMTVGVRTIETYVTRILNKLGFSSRGADPRLGPSRRD